MNLDDLLRDTLHDDRWSLPVPADTLPAVRRKRARRQATRAATAVLAVGALVIGGVVVGGSLPGGEPSVLRPAQAGGTPTPIPGSTPAYTPLTARDWFMSDAEQQAFFAGYQQPSPGPDYRAASPQPRGPLTDRLVAALDAAGVPEATGLERDEADSGIRGNITVHGTLPGGHSLYVMQNPLSFPLSLQPRSGDTDAIPPAVPVRDVPGTPYAYTVFGVSPGVLHTNVVVVTPEGLSTGWSAEGVPQEQLTQWAIDTARWMFDHPE